MKRQVKVTFASLIAVIAISLTIFFTHYNITIEKSQLNAQNNEKSEITPSDKRPVTSLRDINNAFVDIAESVNPTVVTVFTEKVLKVPGMGFSPFNDFFEQFFNAPSPYGDRGNYGGGENRRKSTPSREYLQQGLGSGVIVSHDGYLLTNNHVVANADSINVMLMDKRILPAKVVGTDPKTDIAVIKIKADNLPAVKFGDSDKLRVGEMVLAIGSPMSPNLAHSVTSGIVSAKGRSNVGLADYEDFIQTDAAINPGNSGGALVNLDGDLVGINTAIASQSGGFQGIGFAVPINMAENIMNSLIQHGVVVRGYLGVNIQDLTEDLVNTMHLKDMSGALVGNVEKDGPADKAGVKSGDVIIKFGGEAITNTTQLRNKVAATPPNSKKTLTIIRDGDEKELNIATGELGKGASSAKVEKNVEELLGFSISPLTSENIRNYSLDPESRGVVVEDLKKTSNAFRAGLREGDLITAVNRISIENINDFNSQIKSLKRGEGILLQIQREDTSLFIAFRL